MPPYSPDFNPIELAFSKLKQLIRSAKERSVEALWTTRGNILEKFSESEFRNYFRHAGFRYTQPKCALGKEEHEDVEELDNDELDDNNLEF